jgi:hypothetical protein
MLIPRLESQTGATLRPYHKPRGATTVYRTFSVVVFVAFFAGLSGVTATHADTWDFTYGYNTVYDSNADEYVVSQDNVIKADVGDSPPYYAYQPSSIGVPGSVTYRFTFAKPTQAATLQASLASFYCSDAYNGASSLWASKDGVNWQLLLDDPVPPPIYWGYGSFLTYNQELPSSLLGSDSLWVQGRMESWGVTSYLAQFSRAQYPIDSPTPNPVFQIQVNTVPEPSTITLLCAAAVGLCAYGWRKWRAR